MNWAVGERQYGRVRSIQTLVIHQWAGPSVIAKLAPDSTPDRAEMKTGTQKGVEER